MRGAVEVYIWTRGDVTSQRLTESWVGGFASVFQDLRCVQHIRSSHLHQLYYITPTRKCNQFYYVYHWYYSHTPSEVFHVALDRHKVCIWKFAPDGARVQLRADLLKVKTNFKAPHSRSVNQWQSELFFFHTTMFFEMNESVAWKDYLELNHQGTEKLCEILKNVWFPYFSI
jgi:hypothetical protein